MPQTPSSTADSTTHRTGQGVTVERRYTEPGVHPFDQVEWENRDAVIGDPENPAFEQRGVEFPKSWSQNATNIVAQKYFRGRPDSPERERSVKQMISRVAGRIAEWGRAGGYFASEEDAEAFEMELTSILLNQKAAFNSPVWFNVGWRKEGEEQSSACFILSVDDTMESILEWNTQEGLIFKGGSGSGINLSKIRGSMEPLSKGGIASGPVSFMRGADAWAGTIKSGGKTRRAAKMIVLDVDHPDILDFIWCKAREEEKAAALRDAGFDMRLDSDAFASIQYQNANNSVRVTDEFMERAEHGEDFRVYTHRATADEPGEGVVATHPLAVMRNGVKPIVRLKFANGQELRCTPNHRLWTLNRGYVRAEDLTADDRVLLNDSPTPAEDASWALPVKVEALAKSFSRGGTVTYQELPNTWSEGLGELTGHLIGDGDLTDVRSEWIYGGDDVDDGLADAHEGLLTELIGGVSRQEMSNGTVQLRAGSQAVREFFRGLGVTSARAHAKRVPQSIFSAPIEAQAAFLRGLFGADGCVSRVETGGKANRYVGLGSRSDALLRDVQRLLNAFGIRGRIYRITGSERTKFSYTRV